MKFCAPSPSACRENISNDNLLQTEKITSAAKAEAQTGLNGTAEAVPLRGKREARKPAVAATGRASMPINPPVAQFSPVQLSHRTIAAIVTSAHAKALPALDTRLGDASDHARLQSRGASVRVGLGLGAGLAAGERQLSRQRRRRRTLYAGAEQQDHRPQRR